MWEVTFVSHQWRFLGEGREERHPHIFLLLPLPSKETLRGHSDSSFRGEGYIQCCIGVRLCDMYSNQELALIHFMYGKADGNAALARRLYQERYPQRQCPDRKTFVRLHYRLCGEYGKFNSPGLGRGRPRSTTPEVQQILEAVNMTPSISTRRVALQVNVPHTTVWRLLKEYQLGNSWISTKKGLSSSQWTQAIKMNCNTIPVRTLPGRTLDSTRCRRCDEQETLLHVLGFCHHGELLRINRYNTVRSLIAASIRQNASYEVYEEVGCVSSHGSARRADIIIDRQKDKGVIPDPTIRFEMHEQQPQEVCRQKQVII
ncbi:hypothetical protein ANN_01857 [Periplaneta americana]|uniref:DUF4817 domain-containing protein n=1 Tax=Periplaneta americana TaxID=6978 RepID=A0ABQ8TUS5_PERAM|nr:hypothetical protein ANN_01857 [Periplaneta americana]